jgi:hypothetical protein
VAVLLLPRLRLVVTAVASAGASAYSKPTANMSPRRPDTSAASQEWHGGIQLSPVRLVVRCPARVVPVSRLRPIRACLGQRGRCTLKRDVLGRGVTLGLCRRYRDKSSPSVTS